MLVDCFKLVLDASWQGALAILLLLAIRPLLGTHVPAKWRSALWLVVLVRLLLPTFALPQTPVNVPKFPALTQRLDAASLPPVAAASEKPAILPAASPAITAPRSFTISWPAIFEGFAILWLIGTFGLVAGFAFASVRFRVRILKRTTTPSADVLARWRVSCERMRLRRPLNIRASADVASPALVGVLKPTLLIPDRNLEFLSADDWEHIFLHELAHYRRWDHWTNLLQLFVLCIHWFNPIVWLGMRSLRADRELAADDWALRRLSGERALSYADTLLRMLSPHAAVRGIPGSLGILEDGRQMKRRIRRIASYRRPRLLGSAIGVALILAAAAIVFGRQAAESKSTPASDTVVSAPSAPTKPPRDLQARLMAAARAGSATRVRGLLNTQDEFSEHLTPAGIETMLRELAASRQLEAFTILLTELRKTPLGYNDWKPSNGFLKDLVDSGQTGCLDVLLANRLDLKKLALQAPGANVQMRTWITRRVAEVTKQRADQDALMAAAGEGDLATMRRLLDAGVDINAAGSDSYAFTPLTNAACKNQPAAVRLLLERGAGVDRPKFPGWDYTPLCLAASPEIADILASAGANVNAKLFGRNVPIVSYCVRGGPTEMVRWFLDHGVDPKGPTGEESEPTLLFDAGNPAIAKLLIDRGLSPNARNNTGQTAIFWIEEMTKNPAEIVRTLVQNGADPNARDRYGNTPLMVAPDGETVDVLVAAGADLSAKNNDGQGILHFLGHQAKPSREEALRRHGVQTSITDPADGSALLARAILDDDAERVSVLLKNGADPDASVSEDGRPGLSSMALALAFGRFKQVELMRAAGGKSVGLLSQAAAMGDLEKMEELLRAGTNVEEQTSLGGTPLSFAVRQGQVKASQLLLEYGANPSLPDPYGFTPLTSAEFQQEQLRHGGTRQVDRLSPEQEKAAYDQLVPLLAKHAPAGEYKNAEGETALFAAANRGNNLVLQILIRDKASLNLQRTDGMTPMMVAIMNNPKNADTDRVITGGSKAGEKHTYSQAGFFVKMLRNAGADISIRNHEGKTALDLARERGDAEIVGILEEKSK